MTDETESRDCGQYKPHPAHRFMLGRKVQVCPGRAQSEAARPATAMLADAFEVPLHLIDTTQPVEHCGDQLPRIGEDAFTECILRPGHQGSHANFEGTRWTRKQPTAGYCPHCGRGDAGPTADEYEQLRKRARQDAALEPPQEQP